MSQLGELDCLFCFQKVMTAHYLIATGDVVVCKMRPPFLWCSRYLPKQCAMLNCTLLCISNHLRCSSNSDRICKKLFVDPIPPLLLLPSWLHYRERKERENGIFFFFFAFVLHDFSVGFFFFIFYFLFLLGIMGRVSPWKHEILILILVGKRKWAQKSSVARAPRHLLVVGGVGTKSISLSSKIRLWNGQIRTCARVYSLHLFSSQRGRFHAFGTSS